MEALIIVIVSALVALILFVLRKRNRDNYPPHQSLDKYIKDLDKQRKKAKKSKGKVPPSDGL